MISQDQLFNAPAKLRDPAPLSFAAQSVRAHDVLEMLLSSCLIRLRDWDNLCAATREELQHCTEPSQLLANLVEQHLLTPYQADRICAGKTFGLILGNYRVLDRLGAGGMGVVFKAEHLRLPWLVAIKVLPLTAEEDPDLLRRFEHETYIAAQLKHPNIASAMDAGKAVSTDPLAPALNYLVMEYVPGIDLDALVHKNGPLKCAEACELIYQVAGALNEAYRHHLVHRDIKPSNIMVTPEGQAKLLDFGLARRFGARLTQPGMVLGTLDYMAPEQIKDPSTVDIRADIYGLGATFFWCLTGRTPFEPREHPAQVLAQRLNAQVSSIRSLRPGVPAELEAVITQMLAADPDNRYPTPEALMQVLRIFLKEETREARILPAENAAAEPGCGGSSVEEQRPHPRRILLVDDEVDVRNLYRLILQADGFECGEAVDGESALQAVRTKPYDLAVLDIDLRGMSGKELLQRLRADPPCPHLKILMCSGYATADEMAELMAAGADDFLTKPVSFPQLRARVHAGVRLKEAQDHADALNRKLLLLNHGLEQNLHARDCDLVHARNALVLALAELVGYRETQSGNRLLRLQRYCRCLAEEAAGSASFAGQIDENFIQMLEASVPLHDVGKVGLPDHILQKPGKLAPEEHILMQTHTTIGAAVLEKVAQRHCFARVFLQMAAGIARHHHERFDGQGYPDGLVGEAIPLAARIVAIAGVYDALRSRRIYKPALPHTGAMKMMLEGNNGQFDPALLAAFQRCADLFAQIFMELAD